MAWLARRAQSRGAFGSLVFALIPFRSSRSLSNVMSFLMPVVYYWITDAKKGPAPDKTCPGPGKKRGILGGRTCFVRPEAISSRQLSYN
jgi:hypothetical protein